MSSLWSCAKSQWDAAAALRPVCRAYSDTEQPAASREQGWPETDQERSRLSEKQATWVEVRRAALGVFPSRGRSTECRCATTAHVPRIGGQAFDTACRDRLEQAFDPLEIPIAGHMQRIDQD